MIGPLRAGRGPNGGVSAPPPTLPSAMQRACSLLIAAIHLMILLARRLGVQTRMFLYVTSTYCNFLQYSSVICLTWAQEG